VTADESLNNDQFPYWPGKEGDLSRTWVPIHQIRPLTGTDMGFPVGRLHRNITPGYQRYDWTGLHRYLGSAGVKDAPITVDKEHAPTEVRDGHHRTVAYEEEGRMFVPVSARFGDRGPVRLRSRARSAKAKRQPPWTSPTTGESHTYKPAFAPTLEQSMKIPPPPADPNQRALF
jgi:hypothetical protein